MKSIPRCNDTTPALLNCIAMFQSENFEVVRELFPELSELQCLAAVLFGAGFSVVEIAEQRNVSPQTIKNTLSCVKEKFGLSCLNMVRNVVLLRLILRGLY